MCERCGTNVGVTWYWIAYRRPSRRLNRSRSFRIASELWSLGALFALHVLITCKLTLTSIAFISTNQRTLKQYCWPVYYFLIYEFSRAWFWCKLSVPAWLWTCQYASWTHCSKGVRKGLGWCKDMVISRMKNATWNLNTRKRPCIRLVQEFCRSASTYCCRVEISLKKTRQNINTIQIYWGLSRRSRAPFKNFRFCRENTNGRWRFWTNGSLLCLLWHHQTELSHLSEISD